MKICGHCKKSKTDDSFAVRNLPNKKISQSWCKECMSSNYKRVRRQYVKPERLLFLEKQKIRGHLEVMDCYQDELV